MEALALEYLETVGACVGRHHYSARIVRVSQNGQGDG